MPYSWTPAFIHLPVQCESPTAWPFKTRISPCLKRFLEVMLILQFPKEVLALQVMHQIWVPLRVPKIHHESRGGENGIEKRSQPAAVGASLCGTETWVLKEAMLYDAYVPFVGIAQFRAGKAVTSVYTDLTELPGTSCVTSVLVIAFTCCALKMRAQRLKGESDSATLHFWVPHSGTAALNGSVVRFLESVLTQVREVYGNKYSTWHPKCYCRRFPRNVASSCW